MRGANKPCSVICGPELRKISRFCNKVEGCFCVSQSVPMAGSRETKAVSPYLAVFCGKTPKSETRKRCVFPKSALPFQEVTRRGAGQQTQCRAPAPPIYNPPGTSGGAPLPCSIGARDRSSVFKSQPGWGRNTKEHKTNIYEKQVRRGRAAPPVRASPGNAGVPPAPGGWYGVQTMSRRGGGCSGWWGDVGRLGIVMVSLSVDKRNGV